MDQQIISTIKRTLNYIEQHLSEPIEVEAVSRFASMSQSSFYVVFKQIIGTTIKDYIRKRRLSQSVIDLIRSDLSILDIALKYQYNTYESYSRAFKRLFGISPKKYRVDYKKDPIYIGFPKISLNFMEYKGGAFMIDREMNKEKILSTINTIKSEGYILDIDIDRFGSINDRYGTKIGDQVLVEVPKRVRRVIKEIDQDLDVVRINADEFVVIVKDRSQPVIESLAQLIIDSMKPVFKLGDCELNVTVSVGVHKFSLETDEESVLTSVKEAMVEAKKKGRNQYQIL